MNTTGIIGHQSQINRLDLILKSRNIPNTILFSGPPSIGKRTIALRFLNALFCESNNPPCLNCSACNQIAKGILPDLIAISPNDKGIIPIGDRNKREAGSIRWLIERTSRKSFFNKTGVLIDRVDRATEEGQNALLKSIEEPGDSLFIILITSNRTKLLPTILSRCFEIRYSHLSKEEILKIIECEDLPQHDLDFIADISGGSVEIALLLLNKDIRFEILKICNEISSFLNEKTILNLNFEIMKKNISIDLLLKIITNIYRHNLLSLISDNKNDPNIDGIYIKDDQKLFALLKILLVLGRGAIYNLKPEIALKGMLHALYNNSFEDMSMLKVPNLVLGG
ncbi:MAG: AAA family ATPase [Spirochaetota bacterium]|nr:AAA family ATPase [Spirochaetota bacterium]